MRATWGNKQAPQTFFNNFLYSRKYPLVRLTQHHWKPCIPQFCKRHNFATIRAVTRSSREREVWDSNLGPVKSDAVLPAARHSCDISSKVAVLPGRNDAEMGPANSLHALRNAASKMKDSIWFWFDCQPVAPNPKTWLQLQELVDLCYQYWPTVRLFWCNKITKSKVANDT